MMLKMINDYDTIKIMNFVIRNTALGMGSTVSRIGTIIIPYIVALVSLLKFVFFLSKLSYVVIPCKGCTYSDKPRDNTLLCQVHTLKGLAVGCRLIIRMTVSCAMISFISFQGVFLLIIFGIHALLAAGLSLLLPETLRANLPQTIEDMEEMDDPSILP